MTIESKAPLPDMTVLAPVRDAVDAEHEGRGAVARGAEVLRRGVVTGLLRPGARLPEERLAAVLGISRNSLRAAFDEIEQEHLVERERHRGIRVCLPDEATVHQLYRARLALEGAALRWPEAGTRHRAVEQMSAAVETGRWARNAGQVAAMAENLAEHVKQLTGRPVRVEGKEQGDWVLIDTDDVIVHIFRPEVRDFYQLEKMWMPADALAELRQSAATGAPSGPTPSH